MSKDQSTIQADNEKGMVAITALGESMEKYGKDSAEFKSLFEKTDATLAKQEKHNQELVSQNAANAKECIELKGRLLDMEQTLILQSKSNVAGQDWRESGEYKALTVFAKGGRDAVLALDAETKSLLRTDNDTRGGYLIQNEFATSIIEKVRDSSPVRAHATVMSVGKKSIELPKQGSFAEAFYEGEAEELKETDVLFESETLTAYRLGATMRATNDMMLDSNFDLFNIMNSAISEAFANKEGKLFVNGTGSKQPEGILSNADVIANANNAELAGAITPADLINLQPKLTKAGNRPVYAFNRTTLAFLQLLKGTTNDHFIWQNNLAVGAPNTIGGVPYIILEDMPNFDGTPGEIPVLYGDFKRGYRIIDRTGVTMLVDELSFGKNGIIQWIFSTYNTGQVVVPEAFAGLKIIS